jgi:hypothetical protein
MYLAPILDGQCLNNFPPKVLYAPTEIVVRNETIDGHKRYHHKGYSYQFTLDWGKSLVTEAMYNTLRVMVNKQTQLLFIPYPDKYYNSSFYVKVYGGLENLSITNYIGQGYTGKLVLETIAPVSEMPAWAVS